MTPKHSDPARVDYELAAAQLMRALRGKRSQVMFARRLGFRANPVTDWEHCRRHPTLNQAVRAASLLGVDVQAAFSRFHAAPVPQGLERKVELAAWWASLRGSLSITEIAARCERSRFSVGRWLSGKTEMKLHEFLLLLDAITGRVHDFVFEWVPAASVPALALAHQRAQAAKRLALEHPWTEAILRVLETSDYRQLAEHSDAFIARTLGIDETLVLHHLQDLVSAGVVQPGPVFEVSGALSVDTKSAPGALRRIKGHWAQVGLERIQRGVPDDWSAYNVVSVSAADLERVKERLSEAFRDVRGIVAASEPTERAALVLLQLVQWAPEHSGGP